MRPIFSSHTSKDTPVCCPLCPETLVLENSKRSMCVFTSRKYRVMYGHSQKGCWLIVMISIHSCIQNGTLPPEQGFGDRQSIFVFYVFKWGFPGLFVCVQPRKRWSVVQNLRRVLCHIFWCDFGYVFVKLQFQISRDLFLCVCVCVCDERQIKRYSENMCVCVCVCVFIEPYRILIFSCLNTSISISRKMK